MKVLFDIFHPADVHFFKVAIKQIIGRGDEVMVTSRDKDIALDLLKHLDIENRLISKKGKGPSGLLLELLYRDFRLLRVGRHFKPDIFVGNNSPSIAHVAYLMRRPSIIFEDTEIHRFNHKVYYPLVTEVHSPDCYRFDLGKKQKVYPGYHTLAYLHPNHFHPNTDVINRYVDKEKKKIVFLRFVDFSSIHDLRVSRLSHKDKIDIIRKISEHATVLISSEAKLPSELELFRISVFGEDIHHVLASSDLVIGDSATMCSEASVLGTPSIYIDERGRGYTDDLDTTYGLCFNFKPSQIDALLSKSVELLALDDIRGRFKRQHEKMLSNKIDVSDYQLKQIDRLAGELSTRVG